MLLANLSLENSQKVSVLAASVPRPDEDEDEDSEFETYFGKVSYSSISTLIRQCDSNRSIKSDNGSSTSNVLSSNNAIIEKEAPTGTTCRSEVKI